LSRDLPTSDSAHIFPDMKNIHTLLAVTVAATVLLGCQKTGETIKIGLAGVQTGPDGEIGTAPIRGSQIAIDEWNAKGGVLGKKIESVTRDDEGKPNQAVAVAQELVSAGVVAVVGHFNSGCTLPASDVYHQAGILQITPASTNPKVTERGYTQTFRMCGRDDQQGMVSAQFAHDSLKVAKVAVLHNKTAYGQGIANVFKSTFEKAGGTVVLYDGLAGEELDFRATISALQKAGAQAVFWGGMYNQGGPLYNQLRQAGFQGALLGGDGIYDNEFIKTVGPKADSVFITFGPDYKKLDAAKAFLAAYQTKYGQAAGGYSIYGYDAANTLLSAIQKAGTTDADKVSQALRSQDWPTLQGGAAFDGKGDLKKAAYVIWTIRDGAFATR
jgi:branched-chain amino acid transport system substrate-binding protein